MSDKPIDKAADAIKGTVDKVRDALHEASHTANAETEKQKREHDDTMTSAEKLESMAKEAKERALAEIDNAKRSSRQ